MRICNEPDLIKGPPSAGFFVLADLRCAPARLKSAKWNGRRGDEKKGPESLSRALQMRFVGLYCVDDDLACKPPANTTLQP